MTYSYGEIEAALISLLRVDNERLGAFRARLRHFRNLGVPNVERVGSGTKAEYSRLNAIELCLALRLSALGVAPRLAAGIALLKLVPEAIDSIDRSKVKEVFVFHVVSNPFAVEASDSDDDGYTQFPHGREALLRTIDETGDAIVVDLSQLVKKLDAALSV
jgi:hypothetical protein